MARNLKQVYNDDPITTLGNDDLVYAVKPPYNLTSDAGIKYSDLAIQIGANFPLKDGTGATGTWGIGISGNAATATLASTVTTNANLTGDITSTGNATTYNNAVPVTKGGGLTSISSNSIPYASASNTYGQITAVNNAVLVTSGSGVPSESTTLPSGLTIPGYATTSIGANKNTVYVDASSGNDTTGNGSAVNPYATITKAQSVITTASASNLYTIVAQGIFAESPVLKPFINIFGYGNQASQIVGATLDSTWASATLPKMCLSNLRFSGNVNFSITTGSSAFRIDMDNIDVAGTVTLTGRTTSDYYYVENSEFGSTVTIQDNLYQSYGNVYDGTILFRNSIAPAGISAQFASDLISGALNVTAGISQSITVYVNSCWVGGGSTVTGATANINYTADSYASAPTLASGGTATPNVIPGSGGGTGINNGTKTITLGGNLTTSGAFNTTLTSTATTNSTLPAGTKTLASNDGTNSSGTWAITAANVTTNANLTGAVTSVGNATTYSGIVPLAQGGNNANNAATSGTLLRGSGTAFVPTTFTIPTTFAINEIPYASSANVLASISAANSGVLQTSASGVPSLSTGQTYTPSIGDGTNNFSTSTAQGFYLRVGSRTFVNININWSGKGSAVAGSALVISLPITSGASPVRNAFTLGYVSGITSSTQLLFASDAGTSTISIRSFVSGTSPTNILVSGAATSGEIQLCGWIGS